MSRILAANGDSHLSMKLAPLLKVIESIITMAILSPLEAKLLSHPFQED